MKTTLSLIISYILIAVFGIALCGFFFVLCEELHNFVAGQGFPPLSFESFFKGACFSAPGICVLSQLFLVLLVLRIKSEKRTKEQLISLVCYVLIGVVTWSFIFPKLIETVINHEIYINTRVQIKEISSNYFREADKGFYYYSKIKNESGDLEKADGVFIDINNQNEMLDSVKLFYNKPTYTIASYPYTDILTKDAVMMPKIVDYPREIYSVILQAAKSGWAGGKFTWLCFASIGLALLSLYSLQFASDWKLISVFSVLLGSAGIIELNAIFYLKKVPEVVLNVLNYLPSIGEYSTSSVVYVNIFISAILVLYGIIMGPYRTKRLEQISKEETLNETYTEYSNSNSNDESQKSIETKTDSNDDFENEFEE